MRNLKRALSLALASVMVLGMMVVGAGAVSFDDFSDKDKVVNAEAVSILNTLNVINGKEDGSFDPTGIVTRAEMAKMICVVLNGGKDPNLGTSATTTYTDTANNWAAGYIEFCTNQKIVSGDGTGKFNPTNTVTGAEAAKMLLVAMGYNATYEKMVGAQWATSVNVLANTKGLYDGLTIDPGVGLSRDDAAQMIYNALNADMVEYSNALVTGDNGSLTSIATVKQLDGKTILTEKFGAVKVEGVVMANEAVKLGDNSKSLDAGKTAIKITNADELRSAMGLGSSATPFGSVQPTFSVSSGLEAIGRSVSVYVKPYNANKADSEKATVIGNVIPNTSDKVVVDTSKDSLADVADDNNLTLVTDGSTTNTQVYNQFGVAAALTKTETAVIGSKADGTRGVERTLIDNDGDGEVEIILTNTYTMGKVTKYSTKDDGSITVRVGSYPAGTDSDAFSKDKSKNVVGFDDVEKDDIVLATVIGGKLYVEKAEKVVGDLTAYKAGASLTVDGTKYNVSGVGAYNDSDIITDNTPGSYGNNTTLNSEATFYMDKFGNVAAIGGVEGASENYALLWGYESSYGDYTVKVTLSDGTTGTYPLTTKSGSLGAGSLTAANKGKVYTYSLNSDDEITLTAIAGGDLENGSAASQTFKFDKGRSSVISNGGSPLYADGKTVFFNVDLRTDGDLETTKSVDVYTGISAAPSINSTIKYTIVTDGSNSVKAVVTYDAVAAATGDYMYVIGFNGTNDTGDLYDVIIGNEILENIQTDTTYGKTLVDTVQAYSTSGKGYYQPKNTAPTNFGLGYVTKVTGNSVIVNQAGTVVEYLRTSSSVIATIDGVKKTTFGDSLSKGDYVAVVHDGTSEKRIESAYIMQTSQDEDTRIAAYTSPVQSGSSTDYKVADGTTGDAVVSALTVHPSARVVVAATEPTTLSAAKTATHVPGALTTGTNYIVIVNGDSYAVYTLDVLA